MKTYNNDLTVSNWLNEQPRIIERLRNRPLIIFDTETTGLDFRVPYVQIISLSAAVYDLNTTTVIKSFDKFAYLNLITQERIIYEDDMQLQNRYEKYANVGAFLDKSGWRNAQKSGTDLDIVCEFLDLVKEYPDAILIGHNASFDMRVINSTLKRAGIYPSKMQVFDLMKWINLYVDPIVQQLAKENSACEIGMAKTVAGFYGSYYNLENCAKMFGVWRPDAHVAREDVLMAADVLRRVVSYIEARLPYVDDSFRQSIEHSVKSYSSKLRYFREQSIFAYKKRQTQEKALRLMWKDTNLAVHSYINYLQNLILQENKKENPWHKKINCWATVIMNLQQALQNNLESQEIVKLIVGS